jgi:rhodanese-related sulfurtransferase
VPTPVERDEVARLVVVEDAQLVEVLPQVDFEQEHIAGALNIPLKELHERARRELDRSRPVIVYCNDYQ